MNEITTRHSFRCDLNAGTLEVTLDAPLMHQDALGDVFSVSVWRGGSPVELDDVTVRGYLYLAATQQTVLLDGSVSGSSASVNLESSCYAVPGHASLVIQLQKSTVRHTVLKANFVIDRTCTDTVIDPSNVLPTLPELLAQIGTMEQATAAAKAATADAQQAAADTLAAAQRLSDVTAPPIIPTATGEIVTINDSANRPLAGLRLYGKTTQDGTPTPSAPVPLVNVGAGGSIGVYARGNNLLNVADAVQSSAKDGLTLTSLGGGFAISGTATKDSAWAFALDEPIPAGRYEFRARNTAVSATNTLYLMNADGTDIGHISLDSTYNKTIVSSDKPITHLKMYIRSGTTPNLSMYPQLVFEGAPAEYEWYKDGGSLTASTPNGLPGIPVSSGGNYTDENGQQWLCDEIDFAMGVYIQRVGRILIDNTNTSLSLQNSGGLCQAFASPSPYVTGYAVDPSPYMMCDTLPPVPRKNAAEQAINGASLTGDHILLRVAGVTTIAGMREWLAANPTTVLYQPAQPIAIETPLSASELAAYRAMTSQYPNTTVYNDAGAGMQVDYIADTRNYIDQKLAAIAAATL